MTVWHPQSMGVLIGSSLFALLFKIAGLAVSPAPGIEIHSLTFVADPEPSIVQERTVESGAPLVARWEATVSAVSGNGHRVICAGSGVWEYTRGHKTAILRVDEWVGEDGCYARLPVDQPLQACAEYRWGASETERSCSLAWRKPG